MPKVIFKFDKEKDLWNNWETVNYKSPWEKKQLNKILVLTDMCRGKKFEECKKEIEKFCKPMHNSPLLPLIIESFQKSWNKINDEFFKILEKITGKPMPFNRITGYLTTQMRCPYDPREPSFMVSMFANIPYALKICAHELMHIHFHNIYWSKIEKQVGREKTADLKEALTVLLNLEFRNLWILKDKGKDNEDQQKLRTFIEKQWKKEPDFDILLEKCVDYIKEQNDKC